MTVHPAARVLLRTTFLAHRYLGIGLGVLMLTWCLSGIVMMYVPYPALKQSVRLSTLPPIDWSACCSFPAGDFLSGNAADVELEMLGPTPLLRIVPRARDKPVTVIDLRDGHSFVGISPQQAQKAAAEFGRSLGYTGAPIAQASVLHDQWTLEGSFLRDSPLFKFTWTDFRKPVLYISSRTGAAIQWTTEPQRFWNWVGAIPHWIYFTSLREQPRLWNDVVVWASLMGSFLTLIGLYLGLLQYWRMRGQDRMSPYRGFLFWHHVPGLFFGLFTLTWIVSGLVSMNPWGFLDEDVPTTNLRLLHDEPMSSAQLKNALLNLKSNARFPAVSVRTAPLKGAPNLLLVGNDGTRVRVDESGRPNPLTAADLAWMSSVFGAQKPESAAELLAGGDAYYFAHHDSELTLPVYRIVSGVADHTRYYLDPVSGLLLARFGASARGYRWLHQGAHRLDFVRERPLWDVLMLVLLGGVTFVCGTGAYQGIRRLLLHPVAGGLINGTKKA